MSQEEVTMFKQAEAAEKQSRKERKRKKMPDDFIDGDRSAKDDLTPKKRKYIGEKSLPVPPLRIKKTPKKGNKPDKEMSTPKTVTPKKSTSKKTLNMDITEEETKDDAVTGVKDTPSTKDTSRISGEYMSPPPLRDKHLPPQVSLINTKSEYTHFPLVV